MSKRILVAEDNRPNSILVRTYLSKFGYECDLVADGNAAVAAIRDGDYALALMDIRMPRVDGLEATRQIRALEGPNGSIPILALTANASDGDLEAYRNAGMNDIVTKPIDAADFLGKLKTLLNENA